MKYINLTLVKIPRPWLNNYHRIKKLNYWRKSCWYTSLPEDTFGWLQSGNSSNIEDRNRSPLRWQDQASSSPVMRALPPSTCLQRTQFAGELEKTAQRNRDSHLIFNLISLSVNKQKTTQGNRSPSYYIKCSGRVLYPGRSI